MSQTITTELDDWQDYYDDEDEQEEDEEGQQSEIERARAEALEGGHRYRQVARDHTGETWSIDQYCQNCGGHVSRDYVRVHGVRGKIHACPECTDHSAIFRGAAAGDERRDTL